MIAVIAKIIASLLVTICWVLMTAVAVGLDNQAKWHKDVDPLEYTDGSDWLAIFFIWPLFIPVELCMNWYEDFITRERSFHPLGELARAIASSKT